MTLIQIFAFLSVLTAFGVPQPSIDQIHKILIPENTTPVVLVPTTITSVIENAPVYFGSTAPVIPTPPPIVVAPVVESAPVDKSEIVIQSATKDGGGILFYVSKLDSEGNSIKFATITMETDQGTMDAVAHARQTNTDPNWIAGFTYYPTTAGEKTITFTAGNLTKTTTLTF